MNRTDNRWLSLLVLLTAPLLSVIDVFIINMAIPSIKRGILATDGELQLVIAGYLLGFAGFLITGGRSGDIFGRRKVFFWGMLLFTLTSGLCGLAQTPTQLVVMRVVQGISAAFMSPQTISYIQVLFPEADARTKALGFFGVTVSIAAMLGQLLGGFLPGYHGVIEGWRLIFFINLPVGVAALYLTQRVLKETETNKIQKLDYTGVALLTAMLFLLIYPLTRGRELGWPLWSVISILLSVVLLCVFLKDQKEKRANGGHPLMNMELFRFRDFNLGLLALSFYFMVHTSYLLVFTVHLQEGLGMASDKAGMTFVFYGLGAAISAMLSVRVYIRYGKKVLQFGAFLMAAAMLVQYFVFDPRVEWSLLVTILFVQGLGTGIIIPSLLNLALKSVPIAYAGTAAGVYNTVQQTASALGVSLIGGVFFSYIDPEIQSSFFNAFRYCLIIQVAFLLTVATLLYLQPEKASVDSFVLTVE